MHKKQSDQTSYLKRQGSHGTKPGRRGNIDREHGLALITDEDPITQRQRLIDEKEVLIETIQHLNMKLKITHPMETFRQLKAEREAAGNRMNIIDSTLKALKERMGATFNAVGEVYPRVFLEVAHHMLPPNIMSELHEHTINAVKKWIDSEHAAVRETVTMQRALENLPHDEQLDRWRKNRGQ